MGLCAFGPAGRGTLTPRRLAVATRNGPRGILPRGYLPRMEPSERKQTLALESWRALRILSEFVDGVETMSRYPCLLYTSDAADE